LIIFILSYSTVSFCPVSSGPPLILSLYPFLFLPYSLTLHPICIPLSITCLLFILPFYPFSTFL
jgi:hypothetical protein